jgi:hypothetical protein
MLGVSLLASVSSGPMPTVISDIRGTPRGELIDRFETQPPSQLFRKTHELSVW